MSNFRSLLWVALHYCNGDETQIQSAIRRGALPQPHRNGGFIGWDASELDNINITQALAGIEESTVAAGGGIQIDVDLLVGKIMQRQAARHEIESGKFVSAASLALLSGKNEGEIFEVANVILPASIGPDNQLGWPRTESLNALIDALNEEPVEAVEEEG